MATAAYARWVADGRPFRLATPVVMYRSALYAAGWPNGAIGTIGNEAHLQASTPKDHTPFSATGWPLAHPYPYVTAIDVAHGVSRETELDSTVAYWISEARAGRTPWVKYIIYKGHSWGVRDGWAQHDAEGHHDHVHVSMRTDYVSASIGGWNPLGTNKGESAMWDETLPLPWQEFPELLGQTQEKAGLILAWTGARARRLEVEMSQLQGKVDAVLARLDALAAPDAEAFAQSLASNAVFIASIAGAIATRIGPTPTPTEIAQAVGALRFRIEAE